MGYNLLSSGVEHHLKLSVEAAMWNSHLVAVAVLIQTLLTLTEGGIGGSAPSKRLQKEHIIIIGAGPAGIAAATRLAENGITDFIILESEHRFGGRVNTVNLGGEYVDLGAQWVHGEEGNVVFRMAKKHNLLIKYGDGDEAPTFIDPSGNILDRNITSKIYKIQLGISDAAFKNLNDYTSSLGDYYNTEFPKKIREHSLENVQFLNALTEWYERFVNVEDASDSWFITSGRGQTEYSVLKGSNWAWKNGGYATVFDLLLKIIPDPKQELPVKDKIYYGSNVSYIMWNNLPEEHTNKIIVECQDGTSYIADHVILTVSLGVLKERSGIMFKPALPANKINAIENIEFGTVDKICVKFPYKWWPEDEFNFGFVWFGKDACPFDTRNNSTEKDKEKCWDQQMYVFYEVENHPKVLCGWLSGPAARYMETLTPYSVKQEILGLFNRFMGTAFGVTVPPPDSFARSDWFSNPNFRGSYSFRSMKTEASGASAADLAKPLKNKNGALVLQFAGEATHSTFYSTVHGAIESGWREADRLIKFKQ